MKRNFPM